MKGKTAFRLPPEPSGFMTIGHAMAFTINYLYTEMYDGELWLRFEDTNPKKVAPRYYEASGKESSGSGSSADHEKNVSDDMELIYGYGRRLLERGEGLRLLLRPGEGQAAQVRREGLRAQGAPSRQELAVWEEMLAKKHKEGSYVIRFKGDMAEPELLPTRPEPLQGHQHAHPLTGTKYTLWPTYDLANTIEDEVCGITHVLRSSEFRTELQAAPPVSPGVQERSR